MSFLEIEDVGQQFSVCKFSRKVDIPQEADGWKEWQKQILQLAQLAIRLLFEISIFLSQSSWQLEDIPQKVSENQFTFREPATNHEPPWTPERFAQLDLS